jgi:hypothetical protein
MALVNSRDVTCGVYPSKGPLYSALKCGGAEQGGQLDVYRQKEGYYSRCLRVGESGGASDGGASDGSASDGGDGGDHIAEVTRKTHGSEESSSSSRRGNSAGSDDAREERSAVAPPVDVVHAWERQGPLLPPGPRVGFPFTTKSWDKVMRKKRAKRDRERVQLVADAAAASER